MQIQSENTAINTGVAKSALELAKSYIKNETILDYGSGKLRNSKYLLSKGCRVIILDTPLQIGRLNQIDKDKFEGAYCTNNIPNIKVDKVLCSFVLNVIPEPDERSKVLNNIYNLLKEDGILYCEVRKDKGILANKFIEKYNDGFLVGKNHIKTFQKPFTIESIQQLFANTKYNIRDIKSMSDSYIIIANK